jgi:NADH:ubiquinone oxidoreductase subunit 5 (subunit L)/multisubunit Na+/H+ antiporter MnhA subunit
VLSALLGALYATAEREFKRLLAFSSIENIGIIVTALGLGVLAAALDAPALAALALVAAIFHCINHAAFKSLLFLAAGTLVERLHITDLDQLGGLARGPLRRSAPWVLAGCMAACALPPLNGFASEWLVFNGFIRALAVGPVLFKAAAVVAIAALATTGGLAAAAFIKFYGVGFLGAPRSEERVAPETFDASAAALAFLGATCIVLGVVPALAVGPVAVLATAMVGAPPLPTPNLAALPALALLPLLGGLLALALARARGVREAGTWTCGSPVTARSQYTATVLSKPLRLIFGFALLPQRERLVEHGISPYVPTRIRYVISTRDVFDEIARNVAARTQRLARKMRVFQGGLLRVYLGYALAALLAALAVAR